MAALLKTIKDSWKWPDSPAKRPGSPAGQYTILLIGEVGAGKTSFLNFLCNCQLVLKLGFDDPLERFHNFNDIQLENRRARQMESKTSDAMLYPNIKLAGDLEVGIIDTPGFGDSRGMEEDKKHAKRIVNVLREVQFINCICLVINGTVARMSATLQYVLTEISTILPREVLNNIIVVFTNTADPLDLNFAPSELLRRFIGKEIEEERIFLINNPYCLVEKAKLQSGKMENCGIAKSLKKSFYEAGEMLRDMCTVIENFKKVYTHHFITLYETKQQIDRGVTDLLMEYENQMELERMISRAEEEAEAAFRAKKLHSGYRSSQKVTRYIRIDTGKRNTFCRAKGCFSNCHIDCNDVMFYDYEAFMRCVCFQLQGNHYCKKCGHHYTEHYHNESLHKLVDETVPLIDEEGKRKFKAAQSHEEKARIQKLQLSTKKKASEQTFKQLSTVLLLTIEKFRTLGVTQSYARVFRTQLALAEQRLEGGDMDQYEDLRKTKEEIEKKLKLVEQTLSKPWSHDADPVAQKSWACAALGVPLTAEVQRAYVGKARTSHPDKPGGDDEYFRRVQHAKNVLLHHKIGGDSFVELEGADTKHLRKRKGGIEAKLEVVEKTLSKTLSHDVDPVAQRSCATLSIHPTATKDKARSSGEATIQQQPQVMKDKGKAPPKKATSYEIDMADLKFGDLLGQGGLGAVFWGRWKSRGFDVALKKVNCTPDTSDAQIMMELGRHPNIIAFYGFAYECIAYSTFNQQQPTLPNLICFRTSSGTINVAEQIGVKYKDLGILLLEDTTGAITDAIENECHHNAANINMKIFKRWITGQGRKPISWATLIEVLRDIQLSELAHEIEHNL